MYTIWTREMNTQVSNCYFRKKVNIITATSTLTQFSCDYQMQRWKLCLENDIGLFCDLLWIICCVEELTRSMFVVLFFFFCYLVREFNFLSWHFACAHCLTNIPTFTLEHVWNFQIASKWNATQQPYTRWYNGTSNKLRTL